MADVGPIFDDDLNEDIAWRIMNLEDQWCITSPSNSLLPRFERQSYRQVSALWDHDHCAGCHAKFVQAKMDGCLNEGWAAVQPKPRPDEVVNFVPFEELSGGGTIVRQPPWATDWLCDDCHRILQDAVAGRIKVEAIGK